MQISSNILLFYFRRWTFIGDIFVHTFLCGFIDLVLSSVLPMPVSEYPTKKKVEGECWKFFKKDNSKTAKIYQNV
ncbi:unnamed protein product [Caenorhabditis nigoni]